jgi:sortase A
VPVEAALTTKFLSILERGFLIVGMILLFVYSAALLHRELSSGMALREFHRAQLEGTFMVPATEKAIDFSLWSEKRVKEYQGTRPLTRNPAVAVLRIKRLKIGVPMFPTVDEVSLNRGVGWIPGTARPGESGNVGIAGHRDGFFRGLKDITTGDVIELSTQSGSAVYAVDDIEIVDPDNVGVLRPRSRPSLTLVTCFPFYYVGSAPQRFIVHAALK